jgi:hypothetical protein
MGGGTPGSHHKAYWRFLSRGQCYLGLGIIFPRAASSFLPAEKYSVRVEQRAKKSYTTCPRVAKGGWQGMMSEMSVLGAITIGHGNKSLYYWWAFV